MARTTKNATAPIKLSVDVPIWLRTAIKREGSEPGKTMQNIIYETLSARYPAEKRKHDKATAQY